MQLSGEHDQLRPRSFEITKLGDYYRVWVDGELRIGAMSEYDLRLLSSAITDQLLKCGDERAELLRKSQGRPV